MIIGNSYPYFKDSNGLPLDNGFLYFGAINQNPETNPISIFWDAAFTQPAVQPIRTSNGYIVRDGSIANLYVNSTYSLTVKNKAGTLLYSMSDSTYFDPNAQLQIALADSSSNSNGDALVAVKQPLSNAVARTQHSKNLEIVSIKDFGAIGDGVADDTIAIQNALNSGALSVYVPAGTYLCGGLTMPSTFGFVLYGDGTSSKLKQNSSPNALLNWNTASINYTEGYVKDLTFIGTNGQNHCINTSGVGGITFKNIYISDIPVGYSGIYVNGTSGVYTHDIRIINLQIYSNTAGHAGVKFGPLASDSSVSEFVMNGNFAVDYCLYYDTSAVTIRVANSHPYNAKINIVYMNGSNNACSFNDVVFDNALQDLVYLKNTSLITFTDSYFEACHASKNCLYLDNSSVISILNPQFNGAAGSSSCLKEAGSSNTNKIIGGHIEQSSNFSVPFSLIGSRSYATAVSGYSDLGIRFQLQGCTTAAQAQATTQYLGQNGLQPTNYRTAWQMPYDAALEKVYIAVTNTPAAGQNFKFNVKQNTTTIGTGTINNGSFFVDIALSQSVSQYDQICIESVFSATSGASDIRYIIYGRS